MKQNDTIINIARVGAIAGWLTLATIIVFSVLGPQVIAGQRVSGSLDPTVIKAYFSHTTLAPFNAGEFVFVFFFIPFAVAMREVLSINARARFTASVGLAFCIAAVPMYLIGNALQATLVTVAVRAGDIMPLFRLWDILYNSATYTLEAGYAGMFALAMRDVRAFPRWMPAFGLVVAALQILNVTALFAGIPDTLTLIGNIALLGWFVGANIGMGRLAKPLAGAA